METVLNISEIVSNPVIRGGQPIIAGMRLRVSDIVAYYVYAGRTPQELVHQQDEYAG